MFVSEAKIRVRYCETDKMGVVYHANYFIYLDIGRTTMFRDIGIPYSEIEAKGIMLPVVHTDCSFKRPLVYDENILVKTYLKTLPQTKIQVTYEIFNEKNELATTGSTILVAVEIATKKVKRIPTVIVEALKPYF